MNQIEYEKLEKDLDETVDLVRLYAYKETGYEWMVVPRTGAYRDIKVQHKLYMQPTDGIDNDGDGLIDEKDEFVTKADGGQSPHNFDLARDIMPCKRKNDPWWEAPSHLFVSMSKIAKNYGLIWGGDFKSIYDPPHIEHPRWREVKTAWKAGEIHVG